MKRNAILGIIGVLAFIAILAYMSMGQSQKRVEVCVEFKGMTNCRTASGPTREQAIRTATDTACATITNGMTESMSCGATRPTSVRDLN